MTNEDRLKLEVKMKIRLLEIEKKESKRLRDLLIEARDAMDLNFPSMFTDLIKRIDDAVRKEK